MSWVDLAPNILCQFAQKNLSMAVYQKKKKKGGMGNIAWGAVISFPVKNEKSLSELLCSGVLSISKSCLSSLIKNLKGHDCQLCLLSNSCIRIKQQEKGQ